MLICRTAPHEVEKTENSSKNAQAKAEKAGKTKMYVSADLSHFVWVYNVDVHRDEDNS